MSKIYFGKCTKCGHIITGQHYVWANCSCGGAYIDMGFEEYFKIKINKIEQILEKLLFQRNTDKEDYILKSEPDDIFDTDVPKNFWEDILYEEKNK